MNYHNITKDDMLNGDGLRVVLWVAGCTHHCQGCQNPITWDVGGGIPFDDAAEKELFEALNRPHVSGITFSGGDPLHPFNREEVFRLIKKIRTELPQKTIWLYTGFLWEEIKDIPETMNSLKTERIDYYWLLDYGFKVFGIHPNAYGNNCHLILFVKAL